MKKIVVGITGASGSIFGHRFIQILLTLGHEVHLVYTNNGLKVSEFELMKSADLLVSEYQELGGNLTVHSNHDLFSKIASGSFRTDAMVIIPCSMSTLGKVAHGISDNLMTRTADVMIKENRKLILVVRESPLSSIHLENMLKLSKIGVVIMPPMTSFYNMPSSLIESIDTTVGRILDKIEIENPYHKVWGESIE